MPRGDHRPAGAARLRALVQDLPAVLKSKAVIVQLLRDKIVRFLIKASNLAGLLTSIRQIFPDMEPCQILFQNHGMRMSKIWHTRPLHGNEADAKYHFLFAFWDYYA